ncbi:MAG: tetratricopeptide repeat protein [Desulfuromonadales bacterium]|nr:MAG: tetratricopeptide repeat protein [Desulfuromonadales bacterium]
MKGGRPHLLPLVVLVALTWAVYAGCLGHDFLSNWDDDRYVTANAAVKAFTPENLWLAFTRVFVGTYAPLQIVSYMVDHALWGMRAGGFLLTNILLHTLNGLLFYRLLFTMGRTRVGAFAGGFVFLLHPVQVESVAWISQRKNVLAMTLFLVAFLLYWRYREGGWREGRGFYAGSLVSFVAALLTKSVTVILPPVLLLHDLCFVPPARRGRWLLNKLPYAAAAGIVALVTLWSQGVEHGGGRTSWHGGSPLATFWTMLPVLVRYLGMLFWPSGLSAIYGPPVRTAPDAAVAGAALVLALMAAVGVWLFRRQRPAFFWYALFWIGFLPVSQIVPLITLMNDRYLYFPMLGAAALVGMLADGAWELTRSGRRRALACFGLLPLLALPYLSHGRTDVWRDAVTLWQDATAKTPGSKSAWIGLAEALHGQGRLDEAQAAYGRAIAIDPRYREALNNLGVLLTEKGDPVGGRQYLLTVVRHYPGYPDGFLNLGNTFFATGDWTQAEAAYRRALELRPDAVQARNMLGKVFLRTGRLDVARDTFRAVAAAGGETADLLYDQGCVEARAGHPVEAVAFLEQALARGFRDRETISRDSDLESLRGLPQFRNLMQRYFAERSRP